MMLKLELPNEKHRNMYEKLIKEWEKVENTDEVSPGALFKGSNFNEFVEISKDNIKNNSKGVNGNLFLLTNCKEILGAIHIRHHINNPNLIENGGHIGYGIAPKHRRKGFATKMLELGLLEAKKIGLDKVLITCYLDNIGSNKGIINNGGIFERITKDGLDNRYWIKL